MLYRTHLLAGAAAGLVLAGNSDILLMSVGTAGIAALLPDLDSPHSKLGRLVPFISWPLNITIGHRGVLHSLLAAIAISLLMMIIRIWYPISNNFIFAVFVGYVSHLVLDSFNPSGVPWLWPLKIHFRVPLIQTGSILERLVVIPAMLVLCVWLAWPIINSAFQNAVQSVQLFVHSWF